MHSLYENQPTWPGLEPCVFRSTNTGLNESLGPASGFQQTQNICITFVQRRLNVFDVSPTLHKCHTNLLYLLGYQVSVEARSYS